MVKMVVSDFIDRIAFSMHDGGFIKLSLGNYTGLEQDLKNIYVKSVLIKRELKLSFVYRYKTKDITKNHTVEEGIALMRDFLKPHAFRVATLFTEQENLIGEFRKNDLWSIRSEKATAKKMEATHDKPKERKLAATDKEYLQALRLTDEKGQVYKTAQDKWKQINHYIELLSTSLDQLQSKEKLHVVDMGAGKGYLTFALFDYLTNELKREVRVEGVEYRQDLVELCNGIAQKSSMSGLAFHQGTIEDYVPAADLDVLIALHACDTATDDAIYKGIKYNAELIVVAPCCHKQVRRELEKNKPKNDLDFITHHGIFLERHAEMLTDSIRALLLEYFGYQTKVVQFIADQHTAKNVMIIATKKGVSAKKQEEVLQKMASIKSYFGVGYHHLEKLLGI